MRCGADGYIGMRLRRGSFLSRDVGGPRKRGPVGALRVVGF